MGIIAEKDNGQKVTSSPAQIWEDYSALAIDIFGPNSSPCSWSRIYESLNKESSGSIEICGFNSCPGARDVLVHSHAHSHSHALQ